MPASFSLIDRYTSATLYTGLIGSSISIAADGTAAAIFFGALDLIAGGSLTQLHDANVTDAVIDDRASVIVYETRVALKDGTYPRRLFVIDRKANRAYQLGPDDRDSFQARLSADGQWVEYLTTLGGKTQVLISHPDGSAWKELTLRDDGVVEATLSGDGNVVYATTGDGSLLRIDVASGNAADVVGPTPTFRAVRATTPGSLTYLEGSGLSGASISIGGLIPPVFSTSDTQILFQAPWEVPLSSETVVILNAGNPYFEDSAPVYLAAFGPGAVALRQNGPDMNSDVVAIHADFRSLVTSRNPGVPGETLHVYLTGGGPVTVPVATGAVTPLQPLSRITTAISAVAQDGVTPVTVTYFGLAPGLIGLWQMDLVVPPSWTFPSFFVQIEYYSPPPNSYGASTTVPAIPIGTAR